MDQKTRNLMTMHKALHLRDNVDRLYMLRKEGGRGITGIEDSTNRTKITRKQKWEEKQLYGHFKQQTSEISNVKS